MLVMMMMMMMTLGRPLRLIGGRGLWGRDVTPTQGLPNLPMEENKFNHLFLFDLFRLPNLPMEEEKFNHLSPLDLLGLPNLLN